MTEKAAGKNLEQISKKKPLPAHDQRNAEREEAIAEDADGLEERDMAAEELRVQGDHKSAEPHNHKHL